MTRTLNLCEKMKKVQIISHRKSRKKVSKLWKNSYVNGLHSSHRLQMAKTSSWLMKMKTLKPSSNLLENVWRNSNHELPEIDGSSQSLPPYEISLLQNVFVAFNDMFVL